MRYVTYCPSCGTAFKIVDDQLRIAQGWVRCGQCQAVYKAEETLSVLKEEESAATEQQPIPVTPAASIPHKTDSVSAPPHQPPAPSSAEQQPLTAVAVATAAAPAQADEAPPQKPADHTPAATDSKPQPASAETETDDMLARIAAIVAAKKAALQQAENAEEGDKTGSATPVTSPKPSAFAAPTSATPQAAPVQPATPEAPAPAAATEPAIRSSAANKASSTADNDPAPHATKVDGLDASTAHDLPHTDTANAAHTGAANNTDETDAIEIPAFAFTPANVSQPASEPSNDTDEADAIEIPAFTFTPAEVSQPVAKPADITTPRSDTNETDAAPPQVLRLEQNKTPQPDPQPLLPPFFPAEAANETPAETSKGALTGASKEKPTPATDTVAASKDATLPPALPAPTRAAIAPPLPPTPQRVAPPPKVADAPDTSRCRVAGRNPCGQQPPACPRRQRIHRQTVPHNTARATRANKAEASNTSCPACNRASSSCFSRARKSDRTAEQQGRNPNKRRHAHNSQRGRGRHKRCASPQFGGTACPHFCARCCICNDSGERRHSHARRARG